MEYCLYGDESCQHQNDGIKSMALGCVWCLKENKDKISKDLRSLKGVHGLSTHGCELKWTSVSLSKQEYFMDVVRYFINSDILMYRAVIIPDKNILRHSDFDQVHSEWIYKMWYECIKHIVSDNSSYNIYIDVSEHSNHIKSLKLREVLCNKYSSSSKRCVSIGNVQNVDSKQSEILQLADFLTGAICYGQRNLTTSVAKMAIVAHIKDYLHMNCWRTTRSDDMKFSVLVWEPNGGQ